MSSLRRACAVLVWVVASVVALLSLLLCVTLVLLPAGIPLFGIALRMYAYGVKLMLPRNVLPSKDDLPSVDDMKRKARKSLKNGKKRGASLTRWLWRDALR